jgi:hypothetical protein
LIQGNNVETQRCGSAVVWVLASFCIGSGQALALVRDATDSELRASDIKEVRIVPRPATDTTDDHACALVDILLKGKRSGRLKGKATATLLASNGRLRLPGTRHGTGDADAFAEGFQLRIVEGQGQVCLEMIGEPLAPAQLKVFVLGSRTDANIEFPERMEALREDGGANVPVMAQAPNGRVRQPLASLELAPEIDFASIESGEKTVSIVASSAAVPAEVYAQPADTPVEETQDASTPETQLRDIIAVGLVEGVINFDSKNPLRLSQSRPNDGFEDQIESWSRTSGDGKRSAALRTALFLKGKIKGDMLLTLSYDSDKPGRDRLFRDIDPERWYPVYGDASTVGFEARSSSRLFLRLDKDRHYLMYGDITTGDGFSQSAGQSTVASSQTRDLGQYNRAFVGVRGHLENNAGHLDGYAANDTFRQVVEEFPGRGLSGPYAVSNSSHAVLGSDRIELIVRDRYAPSRIVSTTALQRFVDYTFEPFSGRVLFTKPIPSVDESLNPISVRITYEIDQGGDQYWLYGVNGQYRFNTVFAVGGGYAKDENPLAPFELASANATVNFGEDTWLRAEYARTESLANAIGGNLYTLDPSAASGESLQGDAWRAEFGHHGGRFGLFAWLGESDRNFNNPASSFLGGRRQAGLNASVALGDAETSTAALYGEGHWIEDTLSDGSRTQAQVGVRFAPAPKITLEIGANHVSEHAGQALGNGLTVPGNLGAPYGVGVVSPGFGGGFYGGSTNALNPGTGQTLYNTGAGWSTGYGSWVGNGLAGVPIDYTALRVAAKFTPNDQVDLTAEVEQDLNESEHRRAALGAGLQLNEAARIYGRYELNTGLSAVATTSSVTDPVTGQRISSPYRTNAFVAGVETRYMEGGTLFNEYRMYDASSGRQAFLATGIRNEWHVGPMLALNTSLEQTRALAGDGQKSTAATVSADWRPDELWQLGGRLEWRRTGPFDAQSQTGLPAADWLAQGYDSWLSTLTAARKLNRDWTLLARNYHLRNEYDSSRPASYENRFQAGIAYRDTDTNRFNVLGKYEYWTRRDTSLDSFQSNALLPTDEGYDKHVVSVHADWHPDRVWWLDGRLAAKRQTDHFGDGNERFSAYLLGGRVTWDLSERWDVSALGYRMWSPGGSRQYALGAELGFLLKSNIWLSAGYNARGFSDDDLTSGEYTNQGAYLRLRFKFDETLFRGNDPAINPALSP